MRQLGGAFLILRFEASTKGIEFHRALIEQRPKAGDNNADERQRAEAHVEHGPHRTRFSEVEKGIGAHSRQSYARSGLEHKGEQFQAICEC